MACTALLEGIWPIPTPPRGVTLKVAVGASRTLRPMAACASCLAPLHPGANFCPNCGAKVVASDTRTDREVRKTVTVLFSDLAGSTALGERMDPEPLRALMARYFATMSAIIERHGGTIEKFIGDAIMAVFGVPVVHEDDALRAVRAAIEMRDALADLNVDLVARGLEIRTRTGVNTGEVVTGRAESSGTLVTGDPVNTAARLEQAADANEILIGPDTLRLVRDRVRAEPVPPMAMKGKALPVAAHRLIGLAPDADGRRVDSPMVGRTGELALLRQTWDRVVLSRAPQLFTVLGSAGVGKSRLAHEFLASVEGAATLRGRCLPYGEGITYWPLAEVLRTAAGVEEVDDAATARTRIEALAEGEPNGVAIGARLTEVVGLSNGGASQEELFWAVRRTFESMARHRPVILVLDDLHWAEPTFLDLVEHLADWAREAPLLILVMARPELLEVRGSWGGGKLNATTILLEPLPTDASLHLLDALPGGAVLPDALRRRIAETAEGNPLFLEEMVGMLVEEGHLVQGGGGWHPAGGIERVRIPGSINALLSARLDGLAPGERDVAQRAAVVGRIFERGAVTELCPAPERPQVTSRLLSLVRKELIRPDPQAGLGGDDAFRFRHMLVRDAAYEALPKAERAALHEAFAAWLERIVGDRVGEYEEVVAHHLEQAYGYRQELGEPGTDALGRQAAARLISASRRAQARGDTPAATVLRRQALHLPMVTAERVAVLVQLARSALDADDAAGAGALLDEAGALVADATDQRDVLELHVLVGRGFIRASAETMPDFQSITRDARRAAAGLEAAGDAAGVARALDLLAFASYFARDMEAAGSAWRAAADWASRSGDRAEEARILPLLPGTASYGWATTSEAIAYLRGLAIAHPDSPMLRARLLAMLAMRHAERGDRAEAIAYRDESRAAIDDLGIPWLAADVHRDHADVALMIGDLQAAEADAYRTYELMASGAFREAWTSVALVVKVLHRRGRDTDARQWLSRFGDMAGAADDVAQSRLASWDALLCAVEGDEAGVRAALSKPMVSDADPEDRSDDLEIRAEALEIFRERDAALALATEAATIFKRKEMFGSLARVRQRIARLSAAPSGEGQSSAP